MPHNNHPKTLSEFGITLDQYNVIIDHPSRKATADLWFGTCCNRPIHSFVEIAKIRKLTSQAVRTHMLYVFGALKQYSDDQWKHRLEQDFLATSIAIFRHNEMPYLSYSFMEDPYYVYNPHF